MGYLRKMSGKTSCSVSCSIRKSHYGTKCVCGSYSNEVKARYGRFKSRRQERRFAGNSNLSTQFVAKDVHPFEINSISRCGNNMVEYKRLMSITVSQIQAHPSILNSGGRNVHFEEQRYFPN